MIKIFSPIAVYMRVMITAGAGICALMSYAGDIEIFKPAGPPEGFEPVRMTIRSNGVYYVDAGVVAGLMEVAEEDVSALFENGSVSLRSRGQEKGYIPAENGDGIYFYGECVESIYTDVNVYWLRWYDGTPVHEANGEAPVAASEPTVAPRAIHAEQNSVAVIGFADDPEEDYWIWEYIVSGDAMDGSRTFEIDVIAPAAGENTASLKVNLKGATSTGTALEHHALVEVNGTAVGEGAWTGAVDHEFTVSFSQGLLREGSNSVDVTGVLDSGAPESIFYVDSFDLTYVGKHEAVNDETVVRSGENAVVTVGGFTGATVRVASLRDGGIWRSRPCSTVGGPVYRAAFAPEDASTEYAVFNLAGRPAPESIEAVTLGGLKAQSGDSRFVVITVPEFDSAAQRLVDHRESKGLKGSVVHTEDIYNDFSYGIETPWAIRDFLAYTATNWSEPVEYVLLAGEGTYDYNDRLGYGDNIIPSPFVATPHGLYASDGRLADFDGNGVPDVPVGRLPVMTSEELESAVDKIIAYEQSGNGTWKKQVVMVADKPDAGGVFQESGKSVAALVPGDYSIQTIYRSEHDVNTASNMLEQSLNDGAAFIGYFGHAGLDQLGGRLSRTNALFVSEQVASLSNADRSAIMTSMSCVMGHYAAPGYDCLGEKLVLGRTSGVVAVWAPSGLSMNRSAEKLSREFYSSVFENGISVLGDAIVKAEADYSADNESSYLTDIYNLMGDPAMEIAGFTASYKYLFSQWRSDVFSYQELQDEGISGKGADPDNDGLVNLGEYAFFSDPKMAVSASGVLMIDNTVPGGPEEAYDIVVQFERRKGTGQVTYLVEVSDDLRTWLSDSAHIVNTEILENADDEKETVKVYVKSPAMDRSRGFVRVRVIED